MLPNDANSKAPSEKAGILVVDDRSDKLLAYEVMLGELKQNIVCVRSGKEALRHLLKNDFAAIILDVNMPGMDGFETAALIRQRQRCETTPIIFVSAVNDTLNHISRGYSLGAVDYILTPVVPDILRAKISVFVDLFKKTEQIRRQADEREKLIREQAAAEAARIEAERQSAAKDRFLAMLSHELRTPLTPVLASVLTLEQEKDLPASVGESLQLIRRNVELEARLIDDLLDVTRISKGKVQLNFEVVDAHQLLQNALEIYESEINRKCLGLQVDLSAKEAYLHADPARLQQIFWNLINNAVKFTPQAGRIRISTSNNNGAALRVLLVEDHQDTNRSLTRLLRRRGYQVESAVDVRSALDLTTKQQFDVLVSDLGLPDGSGLDIMRTLNSERPLFGIALTGFGMDDDIRKSRDAGFKYHLVKPIDLNKLDALIQQNAAAASTAGS